MLKYFNSLLPWLCSAMLPFTTQCGVQNKRITKRSLSKLEMLLASLPGFPKRISSLELKAEGGRGGEMG